MFISNSKMLKVDSVIYVTKHLAKHYFFNTVVDYRAKFTFQFNAPAAAQKIQWVYSIGVEGEYEDI